MVITHPAFAALLQRQQATSHHVQWLSAAQSPKVKAQPRLTEAEYHVFGQCLQRPLLWLSNPFRVTVCRGSIAGQGHALRSLYGGE